MNNDQMSILKAALERAAATMRGGMVPPMPFGGPGMYNPTPMANQPQPGMQPTPNAQVAARFGDMAPPSPQPSPNDQVAARFPTMTPNDYVAQNFPQQPHVPLPMARPQMAAAAPAPAHAVPTAPSAPAMSWFQRNALMMRDPVTGMFIDPAGAARAMRS